MIYHEKSNGILIEASPSFVKEKSNPSLNFYLFSYKINITNQGQIGCRLLNRYWIIRNGQGKEEKVFGKGVIGENPHLNPGDSFDYISFCPLTTPYGNMRGSFEFVREDKEIFRAKIPLFFLRPS